jgi:hypothetical protein
MMTRMMMTKIVTTTSRHQTTITIEASTRTVKMSRTLTLRYTGREMTLFSAAQEVEAILVTILEVAAMVVAMAVVMMDTASMVQVAACVEMPVEGMASDRATEAGEDTTSATQTREETVATGDNQISTAAVGTLVGTWTKKHLGAEGETPKQLPSSDRDVRSSI